MNLLGGGVANRVPSQAVLASLQERFGPAVVAVCIQVIRIYDYVKGIAHFKKRIIFVVRASEGFYKIGVLFVEHRITYGKFHLTGVEPNSYNFV